ncbi:MAG: primosomal protein DnaI [Bacilli bacterium]
MNLKTLDDNLKQMKFKKYNLTDSFLAECENKNFLAFVSKINLPRNSLIKYTSLLKKCSDEYHNCTLCPGLYACKNQINGFVYLPKIINSNLQFQYKACKHEQKRAKESKYLNNIYLFDIPKEIKEASMKNIYKKDTNRYKVIKWLKNFIVSYELDKNQKGLYLYGNFGCGKTYLVAALFNELAKKNIKSAIIFWPEYLRDLKASFTTDYCKKVSYIKKVPLLLIDDIGAESMTAWNRDEILCPIIQYRMQEQLPTFFTSNLDMASLEKHFSISKDDVDVVKARRVVERIKQLTDMEEMISENLRK